MRYTDQLTGHGTQAVEIVTLVDGPLAYQTGKYVKSGAAGWTWDTPPGASHAILSATHSDTAIAGVVRGDLMVGNSTPAWSRLAMGAVGQVLQVVASASYDPQWVTLDKSDIPTTHCVSYIDVQAASTTLILASRNWTDETVTAFALQPAHPRIVSVSTVLCSGGSCIGTVTVYGIDADGASISEVFTINDATPTIYNGVKAFRLITQIVTDRTDSTLGNRYSVGIAIGFGVPNYPLNAVADMFAITVNGANSAISTWTISASYGTVVRDVGPNVGDDIMFLYRPYK